MLPDKELAVLLRDAADAARRLAVDRENPLPNYYAKLAVQLAAEAADRAVGGPPPTAPRPPRYAIVVMATHTRTDYERFVRTVSSQTHLGFVDAASNDEAVGKAWRICRGVYPRKDGWHEHFVHVTRDDTPSIDPDKPLKTADPGG